MWVNQTWGFVGVEMKCKTPDKSLAPHQVITDGVSFAELLRMSMEEQNAKRRVELASRTDLNKAFQDMHYSMDASVPFGLTEILGSICEEVEALKKEVKELK